MCHLHGSITSVPAMLHFITSLSSSKVSFMITDFPLELFILSFASSLPCDIWNVLRRLTFQSWKGTLCFLTLVLNRKEWKMTSLSCYQSTTTSWTPELSSWIRSRSVLFSGTRIDYPNAANRLWYISFVVPRVGHLTLALRCVTFTVEFSSIWVSLSVPESSWQHLIPHRYVTILWPVTH